MKLRLCKKRQNLRTRFSIAVHVLLPLCLLTTSAFGQSTALTPAEVRKGSILLFDGSSLFGWAATGTSVWHADGGMLSSDGSAPGYLETNSPFADFSLELEIKLTDPSAMAVVCFRSAKGGDTLASENGYQVSLGDYDQAWPVGSVVHHVRSSASHLAANQWHRLKIDAVGSQLVVLLDDREVARGSDASARAGFIGLRVGRGTHLNVRNVRLTPKELTPLLQGGDLTGWKPVTRQAADSKPNLLQKVIPFGGKPKASRPQWSVQDGAIHGVGGPGEIQSPDMYENFLLQFQMGSQKEHAAIYLRDDGGQASTGYGINLTDKSVAKIMPDLAVPRHAVSVEGDMVGTAVINGRHIQVWVNGFPVTDWSDTRPQGPSVSQSARTSAGPIGLAMLESSVTYSRVSVATLPVTLGTVHNKPAPAPPAPLPSPVVATTSKTVVPSVVTAPTQQAADPSAKKQEQDRQRTASLMSQALASDDPAEQMRLYDQVIQIDPTNAGAVQGYKDAKISLERQQQELQKSAAEVAHEEQNGNAREEALQAAQQSFLSNNLTNADRQLSIANRLAPIDPRVQLLRSKIAHARAIRNSIRTFALTGGLIAFSGLGAFFWSRSRKKNGYLQIIAGENAMRRYELNEPVIHIGSISQDGTNKNEIVVADQERRVSRFHCEVHRDKNNFFIVDLHSSNGTHVDQVRLPPEQFKKLRNGARIELGGAVTFQFGRENRKAPKN